MKKQIPEFPDYYVHSDGYVISVKSGEERIMIGGMSGGARKEGGYGKYKSVVLRHHGKQVTRLIHRLVAEAFIENPQNLPQVNHIDCDKLNNRAENLEWVTAKQNIRHSVDNGLWNKPTPEHYRRMKIGMAKSKSLFTLDEGSEIMEMKAALGLSCKEMAQLVGCSVGPIKRLSQGAIKYFKDGALC